MLFKRIKDRLKHYDDFRRRADKSIELSRLMNADILAMTQINGLLNGQYLPITEYSLRPFAVTHILNDILINKRKTIIEFGSGISTIAISHLIKQKNLGVKLISFDHDEQWQNQIYNDYLVGGFENLQLVHAPLTETSNGFKDNQRWYDENTVFCILKDLKIDLLIVDGPPSVTNRYARFPIIKVIKKHLAENGLIMVDDSDREDESKIIETLKEMGYNSETVLNHCMLSKVKGFNTIPYGKH